MLVTDAVAHDSDGTSYSFAIYNFITIKLRDKTKFVRPFLKGSKWEQTIFLEL